MTQERDPMTREYKFWLIQGFDSKTMRVHIPDPGLFHTEKEAANWCERHSSKTCIYGYQLVQVGSFSTQENQ